jgi:hypothetical protein
METAPEMSVSEAAVTGKALDGHQFTARPAAPQEPEPFLDWRYRLDDLAALALAVTHRSTYNPTLAAWMDDLGLYDARRRRRAGVMVQDGRRLIAVPTFCPWSYSSAELTDVVMFDPAAPTTCSTVTGRAVVLAEPAALAFPMGAAFRLHSDVLSWCRAGGGGDDLFVCDWRAARDLLVGRDLCLVVDSVADGEAVEAALRRADALPEILVSRRAG